MYRQNEVKINKSIKLFILLFVFCNSFVSLASLKKGIYEIENPINHKKMLIDENGKTLIKSISNNSNVGIIKDLFTDEPKYLYEEYIKIGEIEENPYEEWSAEWYAFSEEHRDYSSHGARYHKYENSVKPKNRYCDLEGKEILKGVKGKTIIAAFDDYLIFDDGNFYNVLSDKEILNKEIDEDVKRNLICKFDDRLTGYDVSGTINVNSFYDYVLIYVASAKSGVNGNIYIYDKNSNFVKKIEKYKIITDVYNQDIYEWEEVEYVDNQNQKYLLLANRSEGHATEYNLLDKDLKLVLPNIKPFFRDIDINNKHIYTKGYNKENEGLKEIKGESTDTFKKFSFSNDKIIFVNQNEMQIYDQNFKLLLDYQINLAESHTKRLDAFEMEKVFGGEYYYFKFDFGGYLLFNKSFKKVYGNYLLEDITEVVKTNDIEFVNKLRGRSIIALSDDYLALTDNGSTRYHYKYDIYDKKFNKVIELGEIYSVNCEPINNKNYYVVKHYGNPQPIDIYDENFNKLVDASEGYYDFFCEKNNNDNYYSYYINDYDERIEYNQHMKKYAAIAKRENDENDILRYVDEKFKTICEMPFDEYYYMSDEYAIMKNKTKQGNYSYTLYKIAEGEKLKDYRYIGNLNDDYFTFANGFYYGLMDYDFNVLCQYSIFDDFEEN